MPSLPESFDDVPHAWHMLDGFVPEARDALLKAAQFIERTLDRNSKR